MASKETFGLTRAESARLITMARKAETFKAVWKLERGAQQVAQLAVNAEIRQRWLESPPSVAASDNSLKESTH